jgi:hypothetical protein
MLLKNATDPAITRYRMRGLDFFKLSCKERLGYSGR